MKILKTALKICEEIAAERAEDKFLNYVGPDGIHPSLKLFEAAQIFNPRKFLGITSPNFSAIPKLQNVPTGELELYRTKARDFTLQLAENNDKELLNIIKSTIVIIRDFWISNKESLPNLYSLALKYGFLASTSSDVERLFSHYNKILSDDRRNLSPDVLEKLLFLCFNL